METLKISLENCYGIGGFDYLFNFKVGEKKPKQRAYAIAKFLIIYHNRSYGILNRF